MNDIKTMLDVLKEARSLVDLDVERTLCAAIHRATNKGLYTEEGRLVVGRRLRRWVMSMLEPSGSLVMWLERQGTHVYTMYDKDPDMVREKLRVTRLAWIDWMIDELEKELK